VPPRGAHDTPPGAWPITPNPRRRGDDEHAQYSTERLHAVPSPRRPISLDAWPLCPEGVTVHIPSYLTPFRAPGRRAWSAALRSSKLCTGTSPSRTMMSPSRIPARAAALSGTTVA